VERIAKKCSRPAPRRKGSFVWYTTLTAHRDIANVFESKYPRIKVETYRTGSTDLLTRIMSEAQFRRKLADLVEMSFRAERGNLS
jgi:hypothetical protein